MEQNPTLHQNHKGRERALNICCLIFQEQEEGKRRQPRGKTNIFATYFVYASSYIKKYILQAVFHSSELTID